MAAGYRARLLIEELPLKRLAAVAFVATIAWLTTTSPAFVEFLNSPQLNAKVSGMQVQLDSLAKALPGLDNNLAVIYKNLSDHINSTCKAIYGCDDRREYIDVAPIEQKAADSTLLFVRQGQLAKDTQADTWSLPPTTAGLCAPQQIAEANKDRLPKDQFLQERFYDEPAPGLCTGFKVGKDLVATAGHCARDVLDCQSIRLISGFRIDGSTTSPNKNISGDRIFACKEVVGRSAHYGVAGEADWAVIRVDRELSALPQVTLSDAGKPVIGSTMTVVGYPMGLPVKIAGNANVRTVSTQLFTTNSDTYRGNSGSPVFDSNKLASGQLMVEGILVEGEVDFVQDTPCRISKRCEPTGCSGEDVTLALEFRGTAGQ